MTRIKKVYKIASPAPAKSGTKFVNDATSSGEELDEISILQRQVLGIMALRGAT